jgi:hypothetical protein
VNLFVTQTAARSQPHRRPRRTALSLAAVVFAAGAYSQPTNAWTRLAGYEKPTNGVTRYIRAVGTEFHVHMVESPSRALDGSPGEVTVTSFTQSGSASWTRSLLGDGTGMLRALGLCVGSDGVYAAVQCMTRFLRPKVFIYKLNRGTGAIIWQRDAFPVDLTRGFDFEAFEDGLFVAGTTLQEGAPRLALTKLRSSDGIAAWTRSTTLADISIGWHPVDLALSTAGEAAIVALPKFVDSCDPFSTRQIMLSVFNIDTSGLTFNRFLAPLGYSAESARVRLRNGRAYVAGQFDNVASTRWQLYVHQLSNGSLLASWADTPAGVTHNELTGLHADGSGVVLSGAAYGPGGPIGRVVRRLTNAAASWETNLAGQMIEEQFPFEGTSPHEYASADGAVCAVTFLSVFTGQPVVTRLNSATGASIWSRSIAATGVRGPTALAVLQALAVVSYPVESGVENQPAKTAWWRALLLDNGNSFSSNYLRNAYTASPDFGSAVWMDPLGKIYSVGGSVGRMVVQVWSAAGVQERDFILERSPIGVGSPSDGGLAIGGDSNNLVYVVGSSYQSGVLAKINPNNGDTLFRVNVPGVAAPTIGVTPSSAVYVCTWPARVTRYASTGTQVWSNAYDGSKTVDRWRFLALGSDVPYVVGKTYDTDDCGRVTSANLMIARYNPMNGQIVWAREIAPPVAGDFEPCGIRVVAGPTVLVAATAASSLGGSDFFAARLNGTTGAITWAKRYDYSQRRQLATAMTSDGAGNLVMTGQVYGTSTADTMTAKIDLATGNRLWVNVSGASNEIRLPTSVACDPASNVYVGGLTSRTTDQRHFVQKVSAANGASLWQRFELDAVQPIGLRPLTVLPTSNSRFYTVGTTWSNLSLTQILLRAYNN